MLDECEFALHSNLVVVLASILKSCRCNGFELALNTQPNHAPVFSNLDVNITCALSSGISEELVQVINSSAVSSAGRDELSWVLCDLVLYSCDGVHLRRYELTLNFPFLHKLLSSYFVGQLHEKSKLSLL